VSIINTGWLMMYIEIINVHVDNYLTVMRFTMLLFCANLLINVVETRQIL